MDVRAVIGHALGRHPDPENALLANPRDHRGSGIAVDHRVAGRLLHMGQEVLRAPDATRLLVADQGQHGFAGPRVAALGEQFERHDRGGEPGLHVAGAAPENAAVLDRAAQRVLRPGAGVADREGVEMAVEGQPSARLCAGDFRDQIDRRFLGDDPALFDAGNSLQAPFDESGQRTGIARRVLAVGPHQFGAKRHRLVPPRGDPGAQSVPRVAYSRPRVAARSPRETVDRVVVRTKTPSSGAMICSTSSP